MKKIIVISALLGLIYVLAILSIEQISSYINRASVILSSPGIEKIEQAVISRFSETDFVNGETLGKDDLEIEVTLVHINNDNTKDLLVRLVSDKTCGSGGCLTTMYLQNEFHELTSVNFVFALKSIEFEPNVTNGMHDITINGNSNEMMTWDGSQYTLNTI